MITSAKKKFKAFEGYYLKGELQPHFITNIKDTYENTSKMFSEVGVIQSWFDYCEEKHGKIEQPQLNTNE